MSYLKEMITEWIKEILVGGITSNLSGLFDTVNERVGEIAGSVGLTPLQWNGVIFDRVQNLSETVIVPIAGLILARKNCSPKSAPVRCAYSWAAHLRWVAV